MSTGPTLPASFQPVLQQTLLYWPVNLTEYHYTLVPCGACGAHASDFCDLHRHPSDQRNTQQREEIASRVRDAVAEGTALSNANAFLLLYHATAFSLLNRFGHATFENIPETVACPACSAPPGAACASTSGGPHVLRPFGARRSWHSERDSAARELHVALIEYGQRAAR